MLEHRLPKVANGKKYNEKSHVRGALKRWVQSSVEPTRTGDLPVCPALLSIWKFKPVTYIARSHVILVWPATFLNIFVSIFLSLYICWYICTSIIYHVIPWQRQGLLGSRFRKPHSIQLCEEALPKVKIKVKDLEKIQQNSLKVT